MDAVRPSCPCRPALLGPAESFRADPVGIFLENEVSGGLVRLGGSMVLHVVVPRYLDEADR